MPRIVYLSQLFDPEPTFKGHNFIKSLEDRGFDVEVVTGFPNYPGGEIYSGYTIKPLICEKMGKTKITRLAIYPSHDRSPLKRSVTYASFMLMSFIYLVFREQRADLIYVYYPALTAGLAAIAAKAFRKTPVLLDVQDMWPDSLFSSGMIKSPFLLGIANLTCSLLYRQVDHVLVLSPGFKQLLIERGVPSDKVTVIYNWADELVADEDLGLPEGFRLDDGFRLLFAGNLGGPQRLDTVLDAAAHLQSEKTDCVFYLMGEGIDKDRLIDRAKYMQLSNVRFLPRVPLYEVEKFLAAADALLVHLADQPLHRITIPSKTQAYLYAGRPILMGVAGDAADLVLDADAGYVFPPEDSHALVESIRRLIDDGPARRAEMGRNAHQFYIDKLSRSKAIDGTINLVNRFKKGS